jgi:hypothetical protein
MYQNRDVGERECREMFELLGRGRLVQNKVQKWKPFHTVGNSTQHLQYSKASLQSRSSDARSCAVTRPSPPSLASEFFMLAISMTLNF